MLFHSTNSAAPNCVRLENAGGQYGIYCDTTAKTTTYDATKVDNPAMSTGVPVGSPGMSFASQGSSTANSAPTSTGDTISGNVDESPGISKGIIAGIIVAAICAVLIGAFLGWHFCIKKNRASHDPSYTHATRGSGDIPLSGYIDHETKSTAASSTFPSPPSRYAKHMSSGPWNAESFEHDTPYTPGPEGAELDSTVVIRDHSPNSGSISSFAGSQHAEQQTPTLSHKVSPLVGSDAQGIQQEPALLDGAEVSAISGHQRHPSAGDSLAQRYTPYRPSRGNGLVSGEIGARETGQSSTFPSYLTPENALGGGFEREEQRLKDEARRSGEHL
ncbi:hypothetical protein EJ05DRAFT_10793 [Pseudovirgaria hyperparasitica]|uniref:Uncharacterized protein n=1 Tax=Pseudovirgaria hyperparasitica TaxID=470096 RepID=A0A6A6WKM8_9PEZI|nr:uncharacterized protein EJ05DRAFT_10793 [Pseudovirgaria hyperparasitica]KAF2762727.1 hypothetical protein EJ05DRAFT_10793 [Pseudovirgaria hyperparasitica]